LQYFIRRMSCHQLPSQAIASFPFSPNSHAGCSSPLLPSCNIQFPQFVGSSPRSDTTAVSPTMGAGIHFVQSHALAGTVYVVLSRHRILACRHSDQYLSRPEHSQSGRHERRTAWRETPVSVSLDSGADVPARQAPEAKDRTFIRLYCRRPTHRRATATGDAEHTRRSTSSRDGNSSLSGVYPQSQFQFQATDRGDRTQQERHHRCCPNRKAFRRARSKKNEVHCCANALQALTVNLERLSQETLPRVLFPQPPVIRFAPQTDVCLCGGQLVVQKTRPKTVLSMTGPFIAHETVLQCLDCSRVFGSDALLHLVASRCNVAYDVLVFVGQALFQRYRTTKEVHTELAARNVQLCTSEINYLGRKFISYLAMSHHQTTPRIRQVMRLSGGYVLHLDAMHDDDAPALMTGMDS
jgi:hypothetical protein